MCKSRRVISIVFIIAGIFLLAYPLWLELGTRVEQKRLAIAQVDIPPAAGKVRSTEFGCARLEIPVINLSVLVAQGVSPERLKKSPGWYEDSALPGQGNTCIAAHRSTYGAWFRYLDRLKNGDDIFIQWAGKKYHYTVSHVFMVEDSNTGVYAPSELPILTLTTCQGSYVRLVVKAQLMAAN